MTASQILPNQDILGYVLEHRIGAGGFGEVWKATAPGGLSKAVKIVFGFHDDERAQSELRALETVKELRHPFLLSLERIDIFQGQLVVVSELADKSLKIRYAECRKNGEAGIPRKELLDYLRDAADGLDYLCNKHLLQHLDVKPENLLIVGSHIKVADYGLVKDIRSNNQSILGGMTPTYAAPELFDGRPSQLSDQYSLAIVYQEMLTGIRPFPGKTPAELARQHLKDQPNVDPLPRGDQSVVAKALSKEPNHRFTSCTEFVEELCRRRTSAKPKKVMAQEGDNHTVDATQVLSSSDLPRTRSTEVARRLPPIECDGSDAKFHPTLLIGVGTGALALQSMKERLFQRFGRSDQLAALHMLCLDADLKDLYSITGSDEHARFRDEEVLAIGLRDSDAYRKSGDKYSSWLSRRWIYNIPRSFTTEGIRPLGRLAFADHVDEIVERLHQLIQNSANQDALKKSAAAVGLEPSETPRICIVGSISGGLGSGMIADLAYAVRTVLLEHGLSDESLAGIFFHSLGKTSAEGGLATSNSYSCLRELAHYAKLGYPGDTSIGLPAFDDEYSAAFSDIYIMHCGSENIKTRASAVADYLYLDVATGCNEFFKRCRTGRDRDGRLFLRTLGVSCVELQQERTRCRFAAFLQQRLFAKWSDANTENDWFDAETKANEILTNAELNVDNLLAAGSHISVLAKKENIAIAEVPDESSPNAEAGMLDKKRDDLDCLDIPTKRTLADIISHPSRQFAQRVWPEIAKLIDDPEFRLAGAAAVHQVCISKLTGFLDEFQQHLAASRRAVDLVMNAPATDNDEESSEQDDSNRIQRLNLQQSALVCTTKLISSIQQSDAELLHEFAAVRDLIDTAASIAKTSMQEHTPPKPHGLDYGAVVSSFLNRHVKLFVSQLESFLEKSYLQNLGGLRGVAVDGAQNAPQFADEIQAESRRLVAGSFQGVNFDAVMDSLEPGEGPKLAMLQKEIDNALPLLSDCGGAIRLLLAVPPSTKAHVLADCAEQLFGQKPTLLRRTDGDVAVCFEGQNVLAATVGVRLLDERPDAAELVGRIASRSDVEWIPLTGLA